MKIIVKNNGTGIHHLGDDVRLMVGANEVDVAAWEKWANHKMVRARIEKGTYEVLQTSLSAMKPAQAVKLVGETYDLEQLRRWREEDDRVPVLKAIELQEKLILDVPSKSEE